MLGDAGSSSKAAGGHQNAVWNSQRGLKGFVLGGFSFLSNLELIFRWQESNSHTPDSPCHWQSRGEKAKTHYKRYQLQAIAVASDCKSLLSMDTFTQAISEIYMTLPDLNVYIYVSTTITSLYKTALQFLLPALNNENLQVLTSLVLFSKWIIGKHVHHYHFLLNWLTDS